MGEVLTFSRKNSLTHSKMFRLDRHLHRALQPLLDRALDLGDTERLEFLDDLRTDSPRVVAALEALLSTRELRGR